MVRIRFYTLDGPFRVAREQSFDTTELALEAVRAHVEPHGFTCVKIVEDPEESWQFRVTARTPGGRHGRNVAAGEWADGDAYPW